jgi:hypothetical protein
MGQDVEMGYTIKKGQLRPKITETAPGKSNKK